VDSPVTTPQTSRNVNAPMIKQDPRHPVTLASQPVQFPHPTYSLYQLLAARQEEYLQEEYDDEDLNIFVDEVPESSSIAEPVRHADDWAHDPSWVQVCVQHMLPAPDDAAPVATASLQRELARMLKEQEKAPSLTDLGWYMPLDFIDDNLFQWIVELHSFDPTLPIAQDLKTRYIIQVITLYTRGHF
jgi:ubiquitin-conjugating enzyme E2 Q